MAAKAHAANDNGSWAQRVSPGKPVEAELNIATYNVMNLSAAAEDPKIGDRMTRLAASIVDTLETPDIIALQEVQDNDGKENTGTVDADKSLGKLVDAIAKAGGPKYKFTYISPEDNKDGGQPGSNIRQAFLYNPDKVELREAPIGGPNEHVSFSKSDDDGKIHLDQNPARIRPGYRSFTRSRKPLIAEFVEKTTGQSIFYANLHLISKRFDGSDRIREIQAGIVKGFVNELHTALKENGQDAHIMISGDMNAFHDEKPVQILAGNPNFKLLDDGLTDGTYWTYLYHVRKGVEQRNDLDHMISSTDLCNRKDAKAHKINAGFPPNERASDHNPVNVKVKLKSQPPAVEAAPAQRGR